MGRLQSSHAQRLSLILRPNCCAAKYLGIEIQLDLSKQGYASARVDLWATRTFDVSSPQSRWVGKNGIGEESAVIRPEPIVTCVFPETVIDLGFNGEGDGTKD